MYLFIEYKYMQRNPILKVETEFIVYDDLNTGDIIMCHSSSEDSTIDKVIEVATHSPWEHTGIIIRDPWWLGENKEGLYILQSGSGPNGYPDITDGSLSGVTLNRLDDFLCNRINIYVMPFSGCIWNTASKKKFVNAFEEAHGKPYDKNACSWFCVGISSFFRCQCFASKVVPRQTKTFWCSALVAFLYVKNGWLPEDTDWSCQTPADIITWKLTQGYTLEQPRRLK